MALQDTLDNLRERPHRERRAVAGAVAIGVVAILFVGWAAFFFHSLAGGEPVQAASAPAYPDGHAVVAPSQQPLQWDATAATTSQETPTTTVGRAATDSASQQ